jgi:SAM-dependent methyltransferase
MAGNISTFSIDSEGYSLNRPLYPRELYEFINSSCKHHDIAWDCACGNGQAAIGLAPYFSKIEASDIHYNQVKSSFKHEKIVYSVQNSENTDFNDRYFDAVCVAQALHWFNPEKFFTEVKRVLKHSGSFFCWGYGFFHINKEIDEVIEKYLLEKIDSFWADNNRILHRKYNDIIFPFKKIAAPEIRLDVKWNSDQLISYLKTWSAVKLYEKEISGGLINDLKTELVKYLINGQTAEVKMDFFIYAGHNE